MGRRRDRWQGSGRRVKIDLTDPEPPDNGRVDSNAGDEALDRSRAAGDTAAASPPSNSGVDPENSLSLLGQYNCDDDAKLDSDSNEYTETAKVDEKKIDAEVADFIAELETSGLLDSNPTESSQPAENNVAAPPSSPKPVAESTNQPSLASMIGDVVQKVLAENENEAKTSDWKAVVHESGDYYYWNVVTGETTWNKPDDAVEVAVGAPPLPSEDYPGLQLQYDPAAAAADYPGLIGAVDDPDTRLGSAAVLQLGETICERLNLLCGDALVNLPNRIRLAIEAEIRLADCRLLFSQGLTENLLWTNTEDHIRRLESQLAAEQQEAAGQRNLEESEDVDMEIDMEIEETGAAEQDPAPPREDRPPPPPPPEPEIVPPPPMQAPDSDPATNGNACTGDGALAEAAAAAAKKATKAARVKKGNAAVPVSAASKTNKISSLVNKWIAAKEELHETDDEQDEKDQYDAEAIERKRQRDIDDWRRDQIASGQALENANFQPLGPVDWRDRVKRAKREERSKPKSSSTNTSKKRPDLDLLSKGLAPGWKAYYDEKSGDVYYGNVSTSETSWDRPES